MNERTAKIPAGPAIEREPGEWDRDAWMNARRDPATSFVARVEDDGRRWFVITTEQSEKRVASNLIGYSIKVYVPMRGEWEKRGIRRRRTWILRPMFPGYLFVRLSIKEAKAVSRIRVAGAQFLKFDECFAVASDDDMRRIASASEQAVIKRDVASIWGIGEEVRVGDGVFTGFNAQIHRLDHNGRIEVLLSLLGRMTVVDLDVEQIEKL